MFGPRAFYALALLLIIGGIAAYTRDPDWNLPTGSKAARVASPSGGQAAAPGSSGAIMASRMTVPSNVAPVGRSAAKPDLAADANGAAPGNQHSTFRRITAEGRDSSASVEASKPNPAGAAGLLGDPGDRSSAKPANSGRATIAAADPEASPAPGSTKADAAPKPPAAQIGKEPTAAKPGAGHEAGKKDRKAKRRLPAKVAARRRPWGQPTTMVARSGVSPYPPSYGACRVEMRWAATAIGYQPAWVRVCN